MFSVFCPENFSDFKGDGYMFKVQKKCSDNKYMVYSIRNDKTGFPHFLIYTENQWKYVSAKHYIPVEEEDI